LNYAAKSIYKKSLNNFIEIFISADIQKILKMKRKKKVYKSKKNIVGIDIKPEFPKKANITIRNNFDRPTIKLSNELIDKLQKII